MRLFIKNSTIVDGTGKPGYAGGILLDGKRIAAMGDIEPDHCGQIIDARGMVVAHGFIDTQPFGPGGPAQPRISNRKSGRE